MQTIEDVAIEVIAKGVEVLNAVKPNWVDSMPDDLNELDFMEATMCPLYWAFGGYFNGLRAIVRLGHEPWGKGFAWVSTDHDETEENRAVVNNVWRRVITDLRSAS